MHLLWNVLGLHEKWLDSITSQTRGTGWVTYQVMVSDDLLFHLLSTFDPFLLCPKITRLNKIHISTSNSFLSEGNFNPRCINTLGHLLLDTMADSPVWFTTITNNISFNPIPHILVSFYRFLYIHKGKCQEREKKWGQTATNKLQAQRKT